MTSNDGSHGERSGPLAYMASNGIAANLLMMGIVAAGLVSLTGLEREAWPITPFYHIEVSMAYPGATPEEIEESIVVKIEDQVSGLDDVQAVKSLAAPGIASVRIQMDSGTDMDRALDDIESAVNRIQSFPAGAERPRFQEMDNRFSMMRLIVHGDVSERSLKELAHRIEDDLTTLPSVSQVEVSGVRNYEISIEVPLHRLRALGLTLTDVAAAIRRSSLDLSAGSIDTRESQVRVRTLGQNYDQQDFEEIVLLSGRDGTVVRLGDIAEVRDGFQEADLMVRHQNRPAVFVEVYRAGGEQVMDVATTVREHLANEVIPSLPDGVGITLWNDESQAYEERADLLLKNGILGLLLVIVALSLFLQVRLALWVAVGLVVSGVGALAVMMALDVAINTISLFSFVLAIGIVVDDAIVVAECIQSERNRGTPGMAAAIRGVRRIKAPLTFAVLTSAVAFVPLLFIPGGVGDVWRALPIIMIAMLMVSLVESLFVLPNHLSHLPGPDWVPGNAFDRFFSRLQSRVDAQLQRFVQGPLDRALRFATARPGVTMTGAVGMLVLSISLVPAGIVPTTLADDVEGDIVTVVLEMPDGTTAPRTYEVARELEAAGHRVIERLSLSRPGDAPPLLTGVTVTVGLGSRLEGGLNPQPTVNPQANIATIEFKLLSAQQRRISTGDVVQAWREEVGVLPYVRGITFSGEIFTLGNPVEAVLSHPDPERLAGIASSVVDGLRSVSGVYDIRSDHAPGIPEVQLELRPEARTLGLTVQELAGQARGAFFGAEAVRVQRGREEVRVYVRLPAEERNSITDIEGYLLRTPGGDEVPIISVASLSPGVSPSALRRRDGQRVVTVTADVDASVISGDEANDILENSILADLTAAYPGLTYTFGGEQQQQLESIDALYRGFAVALILIFALLAIPLRSYTKPFIIMAVIPFGFIGVILGHWILGVALSAVSFMGIFGLSGVVVNDSLVMIDFIDQKLGEGASPRTAIVEGAKGRFRPIMLTSLTTFLGFTPLILERAIQAQFLIPFAASLGCGILFLTAILMMVVPALCALHPRFAPTRRPSLASAGQGASAAAATR
ncbi:MAG: efflux RND transporter permease subunit [Holophagales bacterium]|nr:efflux RND transporter permease subunit [Holophagales bacterium]